MITRTDRQALVEREVPGDADDDRGEHDVLADEQRQRLDLHPVRLGPAPAPEAGDEHRHRADHADQATTPSGSEPTRAAHWPAEPMSVKSGRKPEAMFWKPFGKGPTNCPSSMLPVRPRKISMPPSVTMKEGILA